MKPPTRQPLQMRADPESPLSRPRQEEMLLFVATLLFGLAVRSGAINVVFVLIASVALGLSIALSKRNKWTEAFDSAPIDRRLLMAVGLFGLLGVAGWSPSLVGPTSFLMERLPGGLFFVLAVAAFLTRGHRTPARFAILSLAALSIVGVFGLMHIEATGTTGFDVFHLHVAAADALVDGENPYTDAVTVPDGSPNAQADDVIEGYVYPPISMIGYAVGSWLSPNARYMSLVAWLVVLGILGFRATTNRSARDLHVMMLLASVPGLWLVIRAAWTEPLSLMFMAVGVVLWANRGWSGAAIGGMLASKQYFLITAPILLLHRDRGWLRRLAAGAIVLAVTIVPFLVWDASAFWVSVVEFHLSTQPRPDSSNLVGLMALLGTEWVPPTAVLAVLGLAAAFWAAFGSTTRRSFVLAGAFPLAVSFLLTSQTFANYWFLVFGLCALALSTGNQDDKAESDSDQITSPT